MHKVFPIMMLAAASLAPSALPAQGLEPAARAPVDVVLTASSPGRGIAERALELVATVDAVDLARRRLTLTGPEGVVTVPVGPEVESLERIRVGDRVVVRYTEALALELKKHGTAPRQRTERAISDFAPPGQPPATFDAREARIIADVVALDAKTQTITLRGPTRVVGLQVRDPAQFRLVEVGDQVEVLYTETVAVSVEPARP